MNLKKLKRNLLLKFGFSDHDISNYGLLTKSILRACTEYIPYYKRSKYRRNFDENSKAMLNNKYETNRFFRTRGIPVPSMLYYFDRGEMWELDESFEKIRISEDVKSGDYVVKPVNNRWGSDIRFETLNYPKRIIDFNFLAGVNYIIEERLINHPTLKTLSKFSLNTIRFVTIKQKNEISIIFACVRYSSGETKIDNWSSGGYAALMDIETGISGEGIKKDSLCADVNTASRGIEIPYFADAKELVKRAHSLIPQLTSVGWDVAITEDGPILVEGNDDWDVILPQKLMKKGIRKLCIR